jgi:hypothetical protein
MTRAMWGLAGILGSCLLVAPVAAGDREPATATGEDDGAIVETAAAHAVGAGRSQDPETQRIIRGSKIAPVPLSFNRRDQNLKNRVFLGSYIVNAQGGCNDCHTNPPYAPGGDPFQGEPKQINVAGYLAGGVEFGPFTSRNLTPDAEGKPEGHTLEEFKEIMRTGHDLDQAHPGLGPLLQVMPWPVYGEMTDHDLEAIYAYLSAIPSIRH